MDFAARDREVAACSTTSFAPCTNDASCARPFCPMCAPGETCVLEPRECFVNGTVERCGAPGTPERTTAALGCVPPTSYPAVDAVYGRLAPAALTQPETTVVVGF